MNNRPITAAERAELVRIIKDPAEFGHRFLDTTYWGIQQTVLRSLARPHARVAVKGCHASGKTFTAATAVLWFLTRYPDGIVVTTAPTWTSVRKMVWGEIRKALERSLVAFPEPNETELKLASGGYALGLSTTDSERFSGFHEQQVLIVIDEAPGVRPAIYEAIEGIRAGGDVRILAIGNPTVASGPFFDAFNLHRAAWQTFTISAFDTPNLAPLVEVFNRRPGQMTDRELIGYLEALDDAALDDVAWPKLTSPRWVLEKWHEWGRYGSPLWDGRVMGRFPKQDPKALIPLQWIEDARWRLLEVLAHAEPTEAGIDVAGPGRDEAALCVRRGPNVLLLKAWRDPDPRGVIVAELRRFKDQNLQVKVDATGIGYNFALHLRDLGFDVTLVNFGEAAADRERFRHRKDTLYWGLRERFEQGRIAGVTDDVLISQLTGLRYDHTPTGQMIMEPRKQRETRGVPSPDRADALMLAFAPHVPALAMT